MPDSRETDLILDPKFDANGLITAVATDRTSGELLMLAHMNAEALEKTIATGEAHFWSRSRNRCGRRAKPRVMCCALPRRESIAIRTLCG